jgi:hypothetical protein
MRRLPEDWLGWRVDSARFVVIWEIGLYVRRLATSLCVSWSHVMARRVHS